MTRIERSIDVNVPVSTAYNQWTRFEIFPQFMEGVQEVRQLDDRRLHWRANMAGTAQEWDAVIDQQIPDRQISWRSTSGVQNDGSVFFEPIDANRTRVTLRLEYESVGISGALDDILGSTQTRIDNDLHRFKQLIEVRGSDAGAIPSSEASGATATHHQRAVGGDTDALRLAAAQTTNDTVVVDPTMRSDIAGVTPGGGTNVLGAFGAAGTTGRRDTSGVAVDAGRGADTGPMGGGRGDMPGGSQSGGSAGVATDANGAEISPEGGQGFQLGGDLGGAMSGGSFGGLDTGDVGGVASGMQNDLGTDLDDVSGDGRGLDDTSTPREQDTTGNKQRGSNAASKQRTNSKQ